MSQPGRYSLVFLPAAARQIRKLPRDVAERVKVATDGLRDNPRPPGCVKLTGAEDLWRIRLGDYRVIYMIADAALVVTVVATAHRREIHR